MHSVLAPSLSIQLLILGDMQQTLHSRSIKSCKQYLSHTSIWWSDLKIDRSKGKRCSWMLLVPKDPPAPVTWSSTIKNRVSAHNQIYLISEGLTQAISTKSILECKQCFKYGLIPKLADSTLQKKMYLQLLTAEIEHWTWTATLCLYFVTQGRYHRQNWPRFHSEYNIAESLSPETASSQAPFFFFF